MWKTWRASNCAPNPNPGMRAKERLFRFKRFAVRHSRSAMKVGVDGVLLGAWTDVAGAGRILDAGCGCGVIALMCSQRNPQAAVNGIDTDRDSVEEARENAADLPWEADVTFSQCDIADYEAEPFDLIVSNPPFFSSGISQPGTPRLLARHDGTLSPLSLPGHAARLVLPGGRLAMIFPYERLEEVKEAAAKAGLAPIRITTVRGHSSAPVKRVLAEFMKPEAGAAVPSCLRHELTLETAPGIPTEEYRRLGHPFYLYF